MGRRQLTPTKPQLKRLPRLYATENVPLEEKVAVIKFFDPSGRGTWYAIEGQPEGDDLMFFGWVESPLGSDMDELGYFSFNEMVTVKNRWGLSLERDQHFTPTRLGDLIHRRDDGTQW
jgi:Protein of unknown function (DUF2958)